MSDVVQRGQKVKVKVLSFTGNKTSLSMKVCDIIDHSTGLKISWIPMPSRAPLNSPVAPSNFFRVPKDEHDTFKWHLKVQLGRVKKTLNFEPSSIWGSTEHLDR